MKADKKTSRKYRFVLSKHNKCYKEKESLVREPKIITMKYKIQELCLRTLNEFNGVPSNFILFPLIPLMLSGR